MTKSADQNPDQTPALTVEEQIAQMLATMQAQAAQIESLTASQQAPAAQPVANTPQTKGGVWVEQWRTTSLAGKSIKHDEQKQYYDSDKFDQLNAKDERDRSGFEYLGISYKITEDLRK